MTQKKKIMPSLKMLVGILTILVIGGYALAWVVGGPILYSEGRIDQVATVIEASEDVTRDGDIVFALTYNECRGVNEHIILGKKDMGEKGVPERLKKIRKCLMSLSPGSTVPVRLETREHRITSSKTWRVRRVGECTIPHLPSRITVKAPADGQAAPRCSFM